MNAASPNLQDKAAEKAGEPSMEEILASIRRIIADDQAVKPAEPPPAPRPPAAVEEDVLDLAEFAAPAKKAAPEAKAAPEKAAPLDFDAIDFDTIDFDEPAPEPAAPEPAVPEPPRAAAPEPPRPVRAAAEEPEPLTSADTGASVQHAFSLLAHTVLSQNARTLEDLVQEMLRPMLKAWLDDNLPVMVERLVRAEIERVSRGR